MRTLKTIALLAILGGACAPPPDETTETQLNNLQAPVYNTGGKALNVRAKATTQSNVVGSVPPNTSVDINCQVAGEVIDGTNVWDYLPAYAGFVSDAHLWTGYDGFAPNLPRCSGGGGGGGGGGTPKTNGFLLPLECGKSATVTQGRGEFSHWNEAYYGSDFGLALNTPLVAVDDGVVSLVRNDVRPGNACYSGGGQGCANTVNYVVLAHADGTDTAYLHVNSVVVSVGTTVKRGDRVALSGGTGWSTGPHAHVQRQQRCGSWWCQSIAQSFGDVPGGLTWTGQWVTSQNCP
jgi:murein DD-endopeptidase MepM/ murein hydrolase activator NlpD